MSPDDSLILSGSRTGEISATVEEDNDSMFIGWRKVMCSSTHKKKKCWPCGILYCGELVADLFYINGNYDGSPMVSSFSEFQIFHRP